MDLDAEHTDDPDGYWAALEAEVAALTAPPPRAEQDDNTWRPISLADTARAILAGTVDQPTPTIGTVEGLAVGLFYAGRVNSLMGKGGDGKSMVAAYVGAQLLRAGERVWWIDWEDTEVGLAARLLAFGLTPDELEEPRTRYWHPAERLTPQRRDELLRLAIAEQPAMVTLDSTGEWMAAHAVNPNADEEVAKWFQDCARPLADTGAAVVTIDHMPHASDGRLSPIGSTRKYNSVSGAAYRLDPLAEFGRNRVGRARLTTAKDRWGHHVRGQVVAEFTLDATVTPYRATLAVVAAQPDDPGPLHGERPATKRVAAVLNTATEPLAVGAIGDAVAKDGTTGTGLKARTIQDALARLRDLGQALETGTDDSGAHLWIAASSATPACAPTCAPPTPHAPQTEEA